MLIIEKLNIKDKMTDGEECVANFIITLGKDVDRYSTRNIAESTYTSPATVIRLCKKIGFQGFDDFKEQFIKEINYLDQQFGKVDANFPFNSEDTAMRAANKISHLYEDCIQDTMSLLNFASLKKATQYLKLANTIHIFSAGTALNQAESFREKMLKIGKLVSISNNLNYQLYEANCLHPGDIAILISYSGETEKILKIAQICKNRKIQMIVITSFGENTLSQFASSKLVISTKESLFRNLGDFSTHLSISLLLDILYTSYFLQNYDQNYQTKLDNAGELEHLRKSTNPIIQDPIDK